MDFFVSSWLHAVTSFPCCSCLSHPHEGAGPQCPLFGFHEFRRTKPLVISAQAMFWKQDSHSRALERSV